MSLKKDVEKVKAEVVDENERRVGCTILVNLGLKKRKSEEFRS